MAAGALTVIIPASRLVDLAKKFRNEDFLATYTREVQCDSATNYTTTQLMQVVKGLNDTLSRTPGMEQVGKEIAETLKPLIMVPMTSHDEEMDAMSALFTITPDEIKVLAASDEKTRDAMDESARQTATKFKKKNSVDNYETLFYMLTVLAVYYPKRRTFDFYHAYVYCRDTSIWQWARSGSDKKKRMAALELDGMRLLGTTLARQSNNAVTAVEKDSPEFKEEDDILNE